MTEFSPLSSTPQYFYLRIYRANGKLRLEALREAISLAPRPYDFSMEFYGAGNHLVLICIYFDGLEPDFIVTEHIQRKILDYFTGAWFFRQS